MGGSRAERAQYAIVGRYFGRDELETMAEHGHPEHGRTSHVSIRNGRQLLGMEYDIDWCEAARARLARPGDPGMWQVVGLRAERSAAESEARKLDERCSYHPGTFYVVKIGE